MGRHMWMSGGEWEGDDVTVGSREETWRVMARSDKRKEEDGR